MKTPKKSTCNCCNGECDCSKRELDFLVNLTRDIFELDEDIDGLTEWTEEVADQYNKALETIDHNFDIIAEEIDELKARPILKEIEHIPEDNTVWLWTILGLDNLIIILMLFGVI